jgi:asparaginyl-tRNA synthetase
MKREFIKDLYENAEAYGGKTVTLGGWVRNLRDSKAFGFIDLNDGSYFKSAQDVFEREKLANYDEIAKQNVGAALIVTGVVELTPAMKQPFEIKATAIAVEGTSTP